MLGRLKISKVNGLFPGLSARVLSFVLALGFTAAALPCLPPMIARAEGSYLSEESLIEVANYTAFFVRQYMSDIIKQNKFDDSSAYADIQDTVKKLLEIDYGIGHMDFDRIDGNCSVVNEVYNFLASQEPEDVKYQEVLKSWQELYETRYNSLIRGLIVAIASCYVSKPEESAPAFPLLFENGYTWYWDELSNNYYHYYDQYNEQTKQNTHFCLGRKEKKWYCLNEHTNNWDYFSDQQDVDAAQGVADNNTANDNNQTQTQQQVLFDSKNIDTYVDNSKAQDTQNKDVSDASSSVETWYTDVKKYLDEKCKEKGTGFDVSFHHAWCLIEEIMSEFSHMYECLYEENLDNSRKYSYILRKLEDIGLNRKTIPICVRLTRDHDKNFIEACLRDLNIEEHMKFFAEKIKEFEQLGAKTYDARYVAHGGAINEDESLVDGSNRYRFFNGRVRLNSRTFCYDLQTHMFLCKSEVDNNWCLWGTDMASSSISACASTKDDQGNMWYLDELQQYYVFMVNKDRTVWFWDDNCQDYVYHYYHFDESQKQWFLYREGFINKTKFCWEVQ